jgi:hypothetical protein
MSLVVQQETIAIVRARVLVYSSWARWLCRSGLFALSWLGAGSLNV